MLGVMSMSRRLQKKEGVITAGLQPQMRQALLVADKVYAAHAQTLVLTAGLDGEHSVGSRHYYGYAIDTRTRFWRKDEAQRVADEIQKELGTDYYVIFEGNHIHIQYQDVVWF